MRENRTRKVQLRPKLVTSITAGFMIVSTLVSGMAIINNSINVKRIGNGEDVVKAMEEDPTANWDLSKVWIYTDPDGNKVPVPIGWTASGAESERYVNHNVTKTGTLAELTFTPGEKTWEHDESDTDKAWVLNEDNVWVSQNYHVKDSEAELVSNEFIVGADGGYLSIEWSVSSYVYDEGGHSLSITITNTNTGVSEVPYEIKGTIYGSSYVALEYPIYSQELNEGNYVVTIKYTNNTGAYSGLDRGYVKNATILNYDNEGVDSAIVHKYGGFVIYEGEDEVIDSNAWEESKSRNQFVWVPVADVSRIYKTNAVTGKKSARLWQFNKSGRSEIVGNEPGTVRDYDTVRNLIQKQLTDYTLDALYKDLQSEFDETIESIKKYGGFYIGRYTVGGKKTVKRLFYPVNTSWYAGYRLGKEISSNENVQTGMIWGCLFDETLEWLVESGDKTRVDISQDSSNWGNYKNTEFTYININGNLSTKYKNWAIRVPTGSSERNKANNIYDLTGNMYQWTMQRLCYRGCYDVDGNGVSRPSSYRGLRSDQSDAYGNIGFRAFMYIK